MTQKQCSFEHCIVSTEWSMLNQSDAIIYQMGNYREPRAFPEIRLQNQVWVGFAHEAPPHNNLFPNFRNKTYDRFNLTLTFSRRADIPYPYGKIYEKLDI